ncbi:MAG: hypothetical protein NC043_03360 [Muribaculaceae bacterium]|nr:hypothetical protein [Muribaculaceae bacterium]
MKTFLNIAVLLLLTISVIGCSGDDSPVPPVVADDSEMVNFEINVYAGDPDGKKSRAGEMTDDDYFEEPQSQYERMRTLRVIIVRPNGVVEHNEYLYRSIPEEGIGEYHNIRLKVLGGETKQVYIFANEASMFTSGQANPAYDFNAIAIGSVFPTEQINALTLQCDAGTPLYDNTGTVKQYIPMCESFDIDVRAPQADGTDLVQTANLFITRAAVKFGFFVTTTATPTETYTIEEFEIQTIGNKEYLLPNNAEYTPAKYPANFADRYIYEYTVPEGAVSTAYSFKPDLTVTEQTTAGTLLTYTPALYFPETAIPADGNFYIRMRLTGDKEYSAAVPLPNLPSLPRNTYVKINVALGNSDIDFRVDIMPYAAVPLNPIFGFDKLLPHNPMKPGVKPPWVDFDPDEEDDYDYGDNTSSSSN